MIAALCDVRRLRRAAGVLAVAGGVLGCASGTSGAEPGSGAHRAAPSAREAASSVPEITLSAVGDMILGDTPSLPAEPKHYLDPVKQAINAGAQIRFANLEGTLTTQATDKCAPRSTQCFSFRNPPHYARLFAADGFTILNNANNHFNDFGQPGRAQTVKAIRHAGMAQTGQPGQVAIVPAGGHKVAFVGFAPYDYDASLLDLGAAKALIRKARNEARVVVVYMHAGAEGSTMTHVTGNEEFAFGEDRGNPEKFAHMAIRNGASLVIASGPHVLRGMQFYRGHLIAYSLGNFANFHNFGGGGILSESAILHVTLSSAGRFVAGRLQSVTLDSAGRASLGGSSVGTVRSLSKADFGSHAARLSHAGVIRKPA
ncbi:MAG TPA: CapA family protein [Mycobacteriales bacterium]|jgi:poly-gamma-glutamate capsule biosynthesis protein CapA/YwtB (metallophosphatase superfamily)|nr:CapA family protein [Mycobacteriales bacterium]